MLPPISQKPRQPNADDIAADLRAERSVNVILEQKYCDAIKETEVTQSKVNKLNLEAEQAKRRLDEFRVKSEKL